ncbi:hypothetical protein AVEN_182946-1 [Araneus ventricosus]|uniref:Uncharacterized protein n=1 Tax=Araneus ventricosus TaxID=182803 RepID=A0A4Y2FNL5_ARAVE|nr:hypothetical protein AVEN_182946-1 [Araneus ventricosus]
MGKTRDSSRGMIFGARGWVVQYLRIWLTTVVQLMHLDKVLLKIIDALAPTVESFDVMLGDLFCLEEVSLPSSTDSIRCNDFIARLIISFIACFGRTVFLLRFE